MKQNKSITQESYFKKFPALDNVLFNKPWNFLKELVGIADVLKNRRVLVSTFIFKMQLKVGYCLPVAF